jgi:hypothetical protein
VRRVCEHYEAQYPVTDEEQTIRIGDFTTQKRFPESWSLFERFARALGWTPQEIRRQCQTTPEAMRDRVRERFCGRREPAE